MTKHSRSTKAAGQRQLRVGEELRHALARVLSQGNVRDPELENASITVSEVRVSPDLRNATAFVMPLGGGRLDEVMAGLRRSAPYLRGQVARLVQMRYMPALSFEADHAFDHASHIGTLVDSLEREGEPAPGADGRDERADDGA